MNKRLRELLARKAAHVAAAEKINAAASDAGRDLTADEQTAFDGEMAAIAALKPQIEREQALMEAAASVAGVPLEVRDGARIEVVERAAEANGGFRHFGEYAAAVYRAATNPGMGVDQRLMAAAPSTYANEGAGADGGYAVPPEFAREIMSLALEGDSLVPLTDNTPVSGNSMTFPSDETTPWGSSGVRAYWVGEAGAPTLTKPVLDAATLRLRKLIAFCPATDELLADSTAMASYLSRKMGEAIRWKANDAILAGDGVAKPKGVFNADALVSVAKETSQTAATVNSTNVAKMLARLPVYAMARARWVMHQSVLPQLITMTIGDQPIWTPPNEGIKGAPGGLLLGRPVVYSESCATLGTVNDIALVDFGSYRTITKSGSVAIEMAQSMHFYFDVGAQAFRAMFRLDGAPAIGSAIGRKNGSDTLSPFVVLATRS